MKLINYIDLHAHSNLSDGHHPPQNLVDLARAAGIRTLAITDHNLVQPDLDRLRRDNPDMELICGSEISCLYRTADGREIELHLVALGIDPEEPDMARVLEINQPDRRPYINAILDRLRQWDMDLGTYEDLKARFPDTGYLGRMAIATELVNQHFVRDVDEAFDLYLGGGAGQQRRAYVPNPSRYVTLDEAVAAIEKTGVCVLAHLWYYNLSMEENHRLLARFKALGGTAMETEYRRYTRPQRDALKELADRYSLLPSAASDYHGQSETDSLDNRFPQEIWQALKARL